MAVLCYPTFLDITLQLVLNELDAIAKDAETTNDKYEEN